jgi:chromosome segregation ATPase
LRRRVVESEARIDVKIAKLEGRFRPLDGKVKILDSERCSHAESIQTVSTKIKLFVNEMEDMREFVLQKQREQKENFAKNIQSLIPEIGAVYPKMEEIRNEVNMCCAKVDDADSRFTELDSQIQSVE